MTACTVYAGGDVPGLWTCYTRQCHQTFGKTLMGFVRGVLSAQRLGWEPGMSGRMVPFMDAVHLACEFLQIKWGQVQADAQEVARLRIAKVVGGWSAPHAPHKAGLDREQVRASLVVPSPYFCSRGYSPEVLDRFDVGDCTRVGRAFAGRAVVPVYSGGKAVGFTARSVHDQCRGCQGYHTPGPCPEGPCPKWAHSFKFHSGSFLYNWTGGKADRVILVEGPGCVWRVVEAGFPFVFATFGSKLTGPQQVLLEMAGVREVLVGYDDDEAGEAGYEQVRKSLARVCRVRRLTPPGHDFGGASVESVRECLRGLS